MEEWEMTSLALVRKIRDTKCRHTNSVLCHVRVHTCTFRLKVLARRYGYMKLST